MMIQSKNNDELKIMATSGKKLSLVKEKIKGSIGEGVSASEIDALVEDLILKSGGYPSFKMVPGYSWATCINVNDGVVHGIPNKKLVFRKGDIISVDLGMYENGFHTDTAITVLVGKDQAKEKFLNVGTRALWEAIKQVKVGKRIMDISTAIETQLTRNELTAIKALVGHGVGRNLHEDPQIPCFVKGNYQESPVLREGMCLAIEIMYTMGGEDIVVDPDGWTIRTKDGKISALFEETVAVTSHGPLVLTGSK
ncbi:MAG: type I methionyl aminopeptidase [Patescibacteria group bacterium]